MSFADKINKPVHIINQNSNKALDVDSVSKDSEAKIIQYEIHKQDNQTFILHEIGNGYYTVECLHSGLYWDIKGNSKNACAELQQYKLHGGDNQQFRFEEVSNGLYRIIAKHSLMVLDIPNAGHDNCIILQQYPYHGGNNQLFSIVLKQNPNANANKNDKHTAEEQGEKIETELFEIQGRMKALCAIYIDDEKLENEFYDKVEQINSVESNEFARLKEMSFGWAQVETQQKEDKIKYIHKAVKRFVQ